MDFGLEDVHVLITGKLQVSYQVSVAKPKRSLTYASALNGFQLKSFLQVLAEVSVSPRYTVFSVSTSLPVHHWRLCLFHLGPSLVPPEVAPAMPCGFSFHPSSCLKGCPM